jgi:hydroxymethylglutaryl-CoA lyase
MNTYPKCPQKFKQFLRSDKKLLQKFTEKFLNVSMFDVTLRDGLQGLNSNEQSVFTTNTKINLYNYLVNNYYPKNVEIGSCVNTKILPIFKDTEEIFRYTEFTKMKNKRELNHYILIPNKLQLIESLKFGAKNFSFITSVSNSFQFKNTKMSLDDNETHLNNMMLFLDDYSNLRINKETCELYYDYTPFKVKIYISCINECPIEGKISTSTIVNKIFSLSKMNFHRICLSDTCGTLTKEDFVDIIEKSKKIGINTKKFSLHLHIKPERENEVEEIVHTALDYGINEFDVSELKTGGCSVTMDTKKMAPNMSYEQYYKFLTNYLIK